jgi:hypothetical protein
MAPCPLLSAKLTDSLPTLLDVMGDEVSLVEDLFANDVITEKMHSKHLVSFNRERI